MPRTVFATLRRSMGNHDSRSAASCCGCSPAAHQRTHSGVHAAHRASIQHEHHASPHCTLAHLPKAASSGNLLNASKMKDIFAAPRSDFCHVHFLVLCIIPGKASFDQGLPLFSHVLLCYLLCIKRDLRSDRNLSR